MACHQSLRKYSANSVESLPSVGLLFEVSSFVPRLFYISRNSGETVRVITTHTDDFLRCGEPEACLKARRFLEMRFGKLKVQDNWKWKLAQKCGHGSWPRGRISLRR